MPPRALLALVGTLAAVWCCLPPSSAQLPSDVLRQVCVEVSGPFGGTEPVLVTVPRLAGRREHPDGHAWPVLVALHGLGEAQRGVSRGYLGWSVDYTLPRVYEAFLWGSVDRFVLGGLARTPHLRRVNAWLRAQADRGVAVVTPYTHAVLAPEQAGERRRFTRWLAVDLLRQVRARFPGLSADRQGTGIDGISLGGRLALEAGFRHHEQFGAVGGIQPAARDDVQFLADLVEPTAQQRIRLLSSDGDGLLETTRQLSRRLAERRIPHDLVVTPGPHDYAFNRGPGSFELLRFGATALRPEAVVGPVDAGTPRSAPRAPQAESLFR